MSLFGKAVSFELILPPLMSLTFRDLAMNGPMLFQDWISKQCLHWAFATPIVFTLVLRSYGFLAKRSLCVKILPIGAI